MSTHSRLSPSSRVRWAKCPGSVHREPVATVEVSQYATSGTRSHFLLEKCIANGLVTPFTYLGEVWADEAGEYTIGEDRCARVKIAIDYIRGLTDNLGATEIYAEMPVNPAFLIGRDDMSGTVDCFIDNGKELHIIDYKDGVRIVEAVGNMQMEQYAYGVLAVPDASYASDVKVTMTIIQPKAAMIGNAPITHWVTTVGELVGKIDTILAQAAATDDPNAPLVPGEAQCKYCPSAGNCNKLFNKTMSDSGVTFGDVSAAEQLANKDPNLLTDEQISEFLQSAPLLKTFITQVEDEAFKRLSAGATIEGFKLVNGRGSRDWAMEEAKIASKLRTMGVPKDAMYEAKLVSPAKAESLSWHKKGTTEVVKLTAAQLELLRKNYVTKTLGAPTIAPSSDKRPDIREVSLPEGMFEPVTVKKSSKKEAPVAQPEVLVAQPEALPQWLTQT